MLCKVLRVICGVKCETLPINDDRFDLSCRNDRLTSFKCSPDWN